MRKAGIRCPFPRTLCVDMGSCVSKRLHGYCSWKDKRIWWLLPFLCGLKPGLSHELLGQIPDFFHLVVAFFPCCCLQRCQAVSQSGGMLTDRPISPAPGPAKGSSAAEMVWKGPHTCFLCYLPCFAYSNTQAQAKI